MRRTWYTDNYYSVVDIALQQTSKEQLQNAVKHAANFACSGIRIGTGLNFDQSSYQFHTGPAPCKQLKWLLSTITKTFKLKNKDSRLVRLKDILVDFPLTVTDIQSFQPILNKIETIDFRTNCMTIGAIEEIFRLLSLTANRNLKKLSIGGKPGPPFGQPSPPKTISFNYLAKMQTEALQALIIRGGRIDSKAANSIKTFIEKNSSMKELSFEFCNLTPDAIETLAPVLWKLRKLVFASNRGLTDEELDVISKIFDNPKNNLLSLGVGIANENFSKVKTFTKKPGCRLLAVSDGFQNGYEYLPGPPLGVPPLVVYGRNKTKMLTGQTDAPGMLERNQNQFKYNFQQLLTQFQTTIDQLTQVNSSTEQLKSTYYPKITILQAKAESSYYLPLINERKKQLDLDPFHLSLIKFCDRVLFFQCDTWMKSDTYQKEIQIYFRRVSKAGEKLENEGNMQLYFKIVANSSMFVSKKLFESGKEPKQFNRLELLRRAFVRFLCTEEDSRCRMSLQTLFSHHNSTPESLKQPLAHCFEGDYFGKNKSLLVDNFLLRSCRLLWNMENPNARVIAFKLMNKGITSLIKHLVGNNLRMNDCVTAAQNFLNDFRVNHANPQLQNYYTIVKETTSALLVINRQTNILTKPNNLHILKQLNTQLQSCLKTLRRCGVDSRPAAKFYSTCDDQVRSVADHILKITHQLQISMQKKNDELKQKNRALKEANNKLTGKKRKREQGKNNSEEKSNQPDTKKRKLDNKRFFRPPVPAIANNNSKNNQTTFNVETKLKGSSQ